MKKKLATVFTSITLALLLLAMLCGCSTYGKVQKAYADDGWKEEEASQIEVALVNTMFGEDAQGKLTIHVFSKGLTRATVVEFKVEKEMLEELKELTEDPTIGTYVKGFIDDIQSCQIVNGNCVLITPLPSALATFQKSK